MDDLRRMAVFAAVVRHGSMSGAARTLSMSPSAVSQQVRQLELDSGVSLLLRSTRKLTVTAVGERYYEACAAMVAAAERARAELATSLSAPSGELRMSLPAGFVGHLQEALAGLLAEHPSLKLSQTISDMRTDLIAARIDLAIAFGSSLPDSDWSARRLGGFDFWMCASPEYLARRGRPTAPEQLVAHDWFWFAADNRPVRVTLNRKGHAPTECVVTPRIVGDNQDALQRGCLAGMGIASLSSLDVSHLVDSGELVRVLPDWTNRSYGIWALTPRRDAQPSKVKHAIESLQEYLRRAPGASSS
jgi:DNA-binding transcriptional LysR family regulator